MAVNKALRLVIEHKEYSWHFAIVGEFKISKPPVIVCHGWSNLTGILVYVHSVIPVPGKILLIEPLPDFFSVCQHLRHICIIIGVLKLNPKCHSCIVRNILTFALFPVLVEDKLKRVWPFVCDNKEIGIRTFHPRFQIETVASLFKYPAFAEA